MAWEWQSLIMYIRMHAKANVAVYHYRGLPCTSASGRVSLLAECFKLGQTGRGVYAGVPEGHELEQDCMHHKKGLRDWQAPMSISTIKNQGS